MLDKGTTVGGYRIEGALGEGGMGVVYRATQLSLNRSVALKILSSEFGEDASFRERFRREGLLQAAIDHPHIVTVYDTGETEHGLFLAMRMVRGPTLKDMILSRELDPGRSLRLLAQVADALDTAHDVGLTHRDIKPQNILIGARDHAYLADFGLTKAPDEAGRLTATGQFVGTIDYVAPEQIQGEQATSLSDVYALTGVLCECLIGQVPYPKPTEAAVVYAHITEPPPSLTEHRPELPEAIDEVVAKGMAKVPEERYRSAGELLREAASAFGTTIQTAATPPGPLTGPEETGVRGNGAPTQPAGAAPSLEDLARSATAASPVAGAATVPARAPATAPARVAEPRRRAVPLLALALVLAAVGAIAGFVAGGSGSGSESTGGDLPSSASAGSLTLSFPNDWRRVAQEPDVPGMSFAQPIVLEPSGVRGARLVAGQVDGGGPTLLPDGFLSRLPRPPATRDAVKLGRLQAYRYSGLTPEGARARMTVYVAPTTEGVATVACTAPAAGAAEFGRDCERVAASLQLVTGEALALGPREEYARAAGAALRRLDAAAPAAARRLRAARTRAAQARAAGALATAYRRAASRLSAAPAGPLERDAGTRVVRALRAVASGYSRAARAARSGNRRAYAAAGRSVRRSGRGVRRALAALEGLGYSVG